MSLEAQMYQILTPGQLISSEGKYVAGYGVFKEDNKFYASTTGLLNLKGNQLFLVPLTGSTYIPANNDVIIGKITSVGLSSWSVDIRSAYEGVLSVTGVLGRRGETKINDISKILKLGEMVMAKIIIVDRTRDPVLSMMGRGLHKLNAGRLIEVNPVKVPRIIGKNGSMISMIKQMTNSRIYVGKNGRILINAPSFKTEQLVIEALHRIEKQSHVGGLTDRTKLFMQERLADLKE